MPKTNFVIGGGGKVVTHVVNTVPSSLSINASLVVSASNSSQLLQSLTFSNSNGLSFGLSNGVVTASGGGAGIAMFAGTESATSGTAVFSNANGVSFGLDNNTITASIASPPSATSLVYSNSNNVTFGIAGSTLTASASLSQSIQTQNSLIVQGSSGSIVFSNSNGITFGGNNRTITASYTVPSVTNSSATISAGTTSGTLNNLVFSNSNSVSFGLNAGTITATVSYPAQTAYVFSNSNGITFGTNASTVTASYTVPSITNSSFTFSAGTRSETVSQLVFSNSNGVSFGFTGGTATATVKTDYQSSNANYLTSQSSQALSAGNGSFTFQTATFADSNGISFSTGTQGIFATVKTDYQSSNAGYLTSQSSQAISGANGSFTFQTVTFANSNGVSFSTGTQGFFATVKTDYQTSGAYLTTAMLSNAATISNINLSAGTTSNNLSALVLSNSNNVSFGLNGSTITATATFSQSNQTVGLYALGNTTQNSSTTLDARTLSLNALGAMTAGFSNGSIQLSAPATSSLSATGIVSISVNGSTISIGAAQSNQSIGLFAVGNTTQSSSGTQDARSLSFRGGGIVSVGASNGSIVISASAAGAADGVNIIAAGTQTANTTGSVVFSNSNNVSFGMNNSSVVTATVASSLTNIRISAGTTSNLLSAFTFADSNGIAFGLDASTITASYTVPVQTNQTIGLYGVGNTSQNSSTTLDARTLSFGGRGDITVGYSNGTVQISGSQSNQNVSLFALGNTTQNSSTVLNASNLSFNGLGIITAGYSNGSIQLSATQSNQNISLFALNQTTQNSSTVLNANALSIAGRGIVTVGYSNGSIQISATEVAQTNQTIGLYALGNTTQNSSTTLDARTLSFNALGAATMGYSNGSIQISVPSQTNQNVSLFALGNTTQNSSTLLNASNLSFNAIGSLTVGYSNGSIQLSAPNALTVQSAQTLGIYASSNTTLTSSGTIDARSLSFRGIGIASVGYSVNEVLISVPAGAGQTGISGMILSNTTYTSGTASFRDGNGVSWASTTGQGISITHDLQFTSATSAITSNALNTSVSRVINIVAATNNTGGGTASLSSNVSFSNANGVSFYTSAGGAIVGTVATNYQSQGAYLTTAALSTQTLAFSLGGNSATTNSSQVLNGGYVLAGGNGVTLQQSNNTLSFSVATNYQSQGAYLTTAAQSTQTLAFTLAGNVATTNSSQIAAGGFSLAGGNGVTIQQSNATISLSVATSYAASNHSHGNPTLALTNLTGTTASASNGFTLSLSAAAPGAAAESNAINLLGANTAGNTTATGSTIGWSGINLTLSGTNNSVVNISAPATSSLSATGQVSISTNGSTISIGVPNIATLSSYANLQGLFNTTALTWNGASVSHAAAFEIDGGPLSFAFMRIPALFTTASTTIATMASATASAQGALFSTLNAVIYSLGTGANSRSLRSVLSSSTGYTFSQKISVTNSTQASYSLGYTGWAETALTSLSTQYSVSNTNYSFTTNQFTDFTSAKMLDMPFGASIAPGNYWMVLGMSSSSSSAGAAGLAALTNCNVRYSAHYGMSQATIPFGIMGSSNATSGGLLGAASFSTAGGGTTNSINISAMSSMANLALLYFQLLKSA